MKKNIDFYFLDDSLFFKEFENYFDENEYELNFINQNKIDNKKRKNDLLIFEEESFITSIDAFKSILKNYKEKPAVIILSANNNIYNAVIWIREGATDYITKDSVSKKIISNSITGALDFIHKNNNSTGKIQSKFEPVLIPKNADWNKITDNEEYDLAILLFELSFENNGLSRYSKEIMENICQTFIGEAAKSANLFGGRLWFNGNDSGALVFHFGDYINCAILSALSIFNNLFFICYEKLKLEEILSLKIIIHSGNGIYNSRNTAQITSDLINSAAHLIKLFTPVNEIDITSDVFERLNARLINNFRKVDTFEKRKIYRYQFYNY